MMHDLDAARASLNGVRALLDGVTDEELARWVSPENLDGRPTRTFANFEIVDAIDGDRDPDRGICLVRLQPDTAYAQHVHWHSDALLIVTAGAATLASGSDRRPVAAGDVVAIPRGMPHGFVVAATRLEFVSIQSPPIQDDVTGEEDFEVVEMPDTAPLPAR
jgi:mannose-6-phosphate isomerase-like protein (cupin superfamily)